MRTAETRTIDGRRFEITPMGAFRGLRAMERLAKVLGPGVAEAAVELFAGGAVDLAKAAVARGRFLASLAHGFGEIADRLDGTTLEWLVGELAADTMVATEQGGMVALKTVFDRYFAGEYPLLFSWAQAAFEVNFGPLLGGLMRDATAQPDASDAPAK